MLKGAETRPTFVPDNNTCGPDNFMLRDGVCDEITNTKRCLFDGGDCCLADKVTSFCKNCLCNLAIDTAKLERQFREMEIKPFKTPNRIDEATERWLIVVEEVVSGPVCGVLCLDHVENNLINCWQYKENEQVCQCGWVESFPSPEHLVNLSWNLTDIISDLTNNKAYLQMGKTLKGGK